MNLSRLCQALVLPLMVAATAAPAQTPKPVGIGVMTDMAGMTMDIVGPGSVIGAKMAADDFGGKPGARSIEMLTVAHQNKPDGGAVLARRWFDTEGVDVITVSRQSRRPTHQTARHSRGRARGAGPLPVQSRVAGEIDSAPGLDEPEQTIPGEQLARPLSENEGPLVRT